MIFAKKARLLTKLQLLGQRYSRQEGELQALSIKLNQLLGKIGQWARTMVELLQESATSSSHLEIRLKM